MGIVQCANGHYYDDVKYAVCPHCNAGQDAGAFVGNGPAGNGGGESGAGYDPAQDERTSAFIEQGSEDVTVGYADAGAAYGDDRTVGYVESLTGIDPVVGWLVCMDGEERGRDYRLHSGRNFVGRSADMDVTVYDDPGVSRENHCSVIYDPVHGDYLLAPGSGPATYIHGAPLRAAVQLRDGDEIGVGGSVFVFIAFCKGGRKWL